jgi:hypothetical protein
MSPGMNGLRRLVGMNRPHLAHTTRFPALRRTFSCQG